MGVRVKCSCSPMFVEAAVAEAVFRDGVSTVALTSLGMFAVSEIVSVIQAPWDHPAQTAFHANGGAWLLTLKNGARYALDAQQGAKLLEELRG